MPGGFHPFHAGHAALYQSAVKAFPNAEVYVAATNDTKTRPFPFSIKEKLAKLAGVAPGHFIQVKSPFKSEEITSHYNPNEDVLIFVRSEKDKTEQPKPGGTKKDGTPAYFQPYTGKDLQPFSQHAYIAYLPTVEFGPGIKSATEIRNAWPNLDDRRKTAMVMSLYPATQKNPKLASNVVKMLDIGMGTEQINEFAPGNGDDGLPYAEYVVYQCDPSDQFEFIGRPLYQSDSLGMAHKYAYEMFLKHRPKAFVVYQPHKEASRGNYGVKGESDEELNEFAVDGFGDSGDKRSKLLASVGRLLDSGNKVDWQVPGQMGHVTRVQNDGITMKRWKMPHSKMSFFLPMSDDSRDSKYTIKMVAPKHYAVVSAEQGVAEGMVIGCCPNEDINEGKIKDIEDLLARHAQYYLDKEKSEGPLSSQDIHSRESIRKQLLAKKKRLQAEKNRVSEEGNITESSDYIDEK